MKDLNMLALPGPERVLMSGYSAIKDLLSDLLYVDAWDRAEVRIKLQGLAMSAIETLGQVETAWSRVDAMREEPALPKDEPEEPLRDRNGRTLAEAMAGPAEICDAWEAARGK